jgi:hypothetical protein
MIDYAWITVTLLYYYWGDLGYKGSDHCAQLIKITTSVPVYYCQQATEVLG